MAAKDDGANSRAEGGSSESWTSCCRLYTDEQAKATGVSERVNTETQRRAQVAKVAKKMHLVHRYTLPRALLHFSAFLAFRHILTHCAHSQHSCGSRSDCENHCIKSSLLTCFT